MVQQALSPSAVQFYLYPAYAADTTETISDYCLCLFRLGLGGVVEVAKPVNELDEAPAMRTYTLYGYETMVGEIGGWLICVVVFTILLPVTLLGLLLAYCSDSHQDNWNAWQAAERNQQLKLQFINESLLTPNDVSVPVTIIVEGSDDMFAWMVDRAMVSSQEVQATLMVALGGAGRAPQRFAAVSDDLLNKFVTFCHARDDASGPLTNIRGFLSDSQKQQLKNLFLANRSTLSASNCNLLETWQAESYNARWTNLVHNLSRPEQIKTVIDREPAGFFTWKIRHLHLMNDEHLVDSLIGSHMGDLRLAMDTPDDIFGDLVKKCLPHRDSTEFFRKVMMYPSLPRKQLLLDVFKAQQANLSESNRRLLQDWETNGLGKSVVEEVNQRVSV